MQVALQLQRKELHYLLPKFRRISCWSDRLKHLEAPLFPGYVFVRVSEAERLVLLRTPGVINIVSSGGRPLPLAESDLAMLQACAAHPDLIEPHPYLQIGRKVRVRCGPFRGWEGVLIEKRNATRLVIAFEQIARSVSVELLSAGVEQIA